MNHQIKSKDVERINRSNARDKNLTEIDMSAATDEFHCSQSVKRIYAHIISYKQDQ